MQFLKKKILKKNEKLRNWDEINLEKQNDYDKTRGSLLLF